MLCINTDPDEWRSLPVQQGLMGGWGQRSQVAGCAAGRSEGFWTVPHCCSLDHFLVMKMMMVVMTMTMMKKMVFKIKQKQKNKK